VAGTGNVAGYRVPAALLRLAHHLIILPSRILLASRLLAPLVATLPHSGVRTRRRRAIIGEKIIASYGIAKNAAHRGENRRVNSAWRESINAPSAYLGDGHGGGILACCA
jgi:hypothetical protein